MTTAATASTTTAPPTTASGAAASGHELDERFLVRRVHDRFGFGPDAAALAGAADGSATGAFDALLAAAGDGAATGVSAPEFADVPRRGKNADADGDADAKKQRAQVRRSHRQALLHWWLPTAVGSPHQVTERLAWFWSGHFATSIAKVKLGPPMYGQYATFRRLATGSFGDLAQAMIIDPALLIWLDGNDNVVGAANENLSREYLELFTLGHGGYSETDVREAARALTGWTVARRTGKARVVADRHDDTEKTVLGVTADLDAQALVEIVLGRPECARFVIRRLWFRLVSAAAPDDATLEQLVGAYGAGGDIAAVLREMVGTKTFRSEDASLVKQPVEWMVGLLRALRVDLSTVDEKARTKLLAGMRGLGQQPFAPPSVGGWPAGAAWLTTATSVARFRTAQQIVRLAADSVDLGSTPAARVDGAGTLLGVDTWTDRTRAALTAVAGNPQDTLVVAACSPEYVVSR